MDDPRRAGTASAVLRAILDNGPVARSTVGRHTGLSPAAVSKQCAELAALGLVRERPVRRTRATIGRPHVPVDVDTVTHVVGGVHIGLSRVTYVLMDLRGQVLAELRVAHEDPAPAPLLAGIGDRMAAFVREHAGARRPLGIGLATGGWVDPIHGVIVRHGPLGWRDVPARAALERRLGLPVHVESHSRALARAEQLIGAHRHRARASLVHMFVGNVVDAAIATGGAVHHGPGSAAGDVSHLPVGGSTPCPCGRRGCFQATVADRTLGIRERVRLVGRAAALLLDVINPEILVVTDAGLARRPELIDDLRAEVARRSHLGQRADAVVAGSFGTQALGVAAGSVALHEVYTRPLAARNAAHAS